MFWLANAEILDGHYKKNVIQIGSKITLFDYRNNEEVVYKILSDIEIDPFKNVISNKSPIFIAIKDKKPGDLVIIKEIPVPYKVKILNIE